MKIAISMVILSFLGAVLGVVLAVSEVPSAPSVAELGSAPGEPAPQPAANVPEANVKGSEAGNDSEPVKPPVEGASDTAEQGSVTDSSTRKTFPKIKIDEEVYDFGSMKDEQKGHHDFVIENVGSAPLTLKVKSTTCKCTKGEVRKEQLYPGEKTELVLEWDPKGYTGDFEQIATLATNDPQRDKIELKVKGRVHAPMAIIPRTIYFGDISDRYESEGVVRLYLFEDPDAKIETIRLLNKATASYYSIDKEKLSPQELQLQPDAKAGYLIRVKIKSGMIQGPIAQKAEIVTDSKKLGSIELPIEGEVAGNIAIHGPGWESKKNLLNLGIVKGQKGIKRTLLIVTRYVKGKPETLKVASVTPADLLKVSLSDQKDDEKEGRGCAKLTVEIPPGSPSANYFGSSESPFGHIVLESGGPGGSKFDLRVKVLVQSQ